MMGEVEGVGGAIGWALGGGAPHTPGLHLHHRDELVWVRRLSHQHLGAASASAQKAAVQYIPAAHGGEWRWQERLHTLHRTTRAWDWGEACGTSPVRTWHAPIAHDTPLGARATPL